MPKNLNIDEEYQNQKDLIAAIRGNQATRDLQKNKTFKSKKFKTKGVLEQLPAEYQNSVLQVYATTIEYDYTQPWAAPSQSSHRGSSFILNYNNQNFIVTNAHVAGKSRTLQVRFTEEAQKYSAKVILIEPDCDLALLDITKDKEKFWSKAKPLSLLDRMFKVGEKLNVCGFPMGGNELCVTEGQVSRIEVSSYVESVSGGSEVELLQGQVSAAINPGNSGGPVLSNKKVIGVAFQGSDCGEGLGYIIPPPVLKHFLNKSLFPGLAIEIQEIKNEITKKYLKLSKDETGVVINKVHKLSSANKLLKKHDVIMSIDGIQVNDDGTISTEFSNRINYKHLISMKNIGDPLVLQIKRNGVKLSITVNLYNKSGTTCIVPPEERENKPSYIVESGVVLMPVTGNYVEMDNIDVVDESKPKNKLWQQIVIVKEVLNSSFIEEVPDLEDQRIKLINNKKINNMRDAVQVLRNNKEQFHSVEFMNKQLLVIPNLTVIERSTLFKELGIDKPCSDDLTCEALSKPLKAKIGYPEYWMPQFAEKRKQQSYKTDKTEDTEITIKHSKRPRLD